MALSASTTLEEADKLSQMTQWLNEQLPWLGWGVAVFMLFAIAIAAIAKLTGNLDKILGFWTKYLKKASAELSEKQLAYLRQSLLKQMKTDVAGRLDDSLHNLVRVDIEQEEQRHQVGRRKLPLAEMQVKKPPRFRRLVQRGLKVFSKSQVVEPVAPAEKTYSIFHRDDIGGRLLILGEPGAGKTTELLTVAQRFIEEAIKDSSQPVPLIFELSNWKPDTPIISWLGERLQKTYGVSQKLAKPLAQQWIQQERLLLLLDGLDELGQRNQVACIETLEDFLAQHPALSTIVCCRREEYEQGGKQLRQLNGAVYLQAVGQRQVQQYLKDLGREQLWSDIQSSHELLKLTESPLFLTIIVVAYQGQPIWNTASLLDAYIQNQLQDPNRRGIYKPGKEKTPQQTLRYLHWLAEQLKQHRETELLIENLQPDWLCDRKQERNYKAISGLAGGLVIGLIIGLSTAVFSWLMIILTQGLDIGLVNGLISLIMSIILGLFYGLVLGLILGLIGGLVCIMLGKLSNIELAEQLDFSFRRGVEKGLKEGLSTAGKAALVGALASAVFLGLVGGLVSALLAALIGGLAAGLLFGFSFGLIDGLFSLLETSSIQRKMMPNQGIRRSLYNAMVSGVIFMLVGGFLGLLAGWLVDVLITKASNGQTLGLDSDIKLGCGLLSALFFELIGLSTGGVEATIKHLAIRIVLTKSGYTPWNYAKFLEHATRLRFIQRTGGRYRFVHDLLREHFAQMTPQQQKAIAQER